MTISATRDQLPVGTTTSTPRLRSWAGRRPLTAFLVLTFSLAYTLVTVVYLAYRGAIPGRSLLAGLPIPIDEFVGAVTILSLFPAALYVTWAGEGRPGVRRLLRRATRWRVHFGWWLLVLFALPVLTTGTAVLLGDTLRSVDVADVFLTQSALLAVNFVVTNLWEETSWAGVLQTRLERRHNLFTAAVLTAVPFAFLHLPLKLFLGPVTATSLLFGWLGYFGDTRGLTVLGAVVVLTATTAVAIRHRLTRAQRHDLDDLGATMTTRTVRDRAAHHRERPVAQPTSRTGGADSSSLRPLVHFAAVALPMGWLMLSIPVLTGVPDAPFVLATLLLGLVVPSLVLTGREAGRAGLRALLRDAIRLPRPWIWLPLAAGVLPVLVCTAAAARGAAPPITAAFLTGWVSTLLSSFLIVNLAEETAWTGFAQRRAIARWGTVWGSIVTALLFAGVHLPLAFVQAHSGWDVAEGVAVLVLTGIGLRLIIACLDGWSGRSLLTVGLLHASFNATGDLAGTWTRLAITFALGLTVVIVHRSTTRHR